MTTERKQAEEILDKHIPDWEMWSTEKVLDAMIELASLLEQHKEMMLREELIRFKLWYNAGDPHDHILTREIDEYLKTK